ncbi:MAG: glutathione peroxidase [Hyphomicrobiaceae bacterium]
MKKLLAALSAAAILVQPAVTAARDTAAQTGSAHDFTFQSIEGRPMPLVELAGKVLLIVNTASLCGFTKQYDTLQALHERLESRGFSVIGVPSGDFGGQELGSSGEIKTFCETNFNITFPLTEKTSVRGAASHPFYAWARLTLGDAAAPRWNFHKYLVGRDGRLIAAFSTQTRPDDPRILSAIEDALKSEPS